MTSHRKDVNDLVDSLVGRPGTPSSSRIPTPSTARPPSSAAIRPPSRSGRATPSGSIPDTPGGRTSRMSGMGSGERRAGMIEAAVGNGSVERYVVMQ